MVEAMTTNETFFFRDRVPFDLFRDVVLPEALARNAARRKLRIWCAAASTGQEPYSLAMLLQEAAPRLAGWQVDLVATDISTEVLEKAKLGIYSQFEVQRGLPVQWLLKYFTQSGDQWQIAPSLRAMVEFRQFNLLQGFEALGTFDVIFCRNVLIYFDAPTKSEILARFGTSLAPGGALLLGAAETVIASPIASCRTRPTGPLRPRSGPAGGDPAGGRRLRSPGVSPSRRRRGEGARGIEARGGTRPPTGAASFPRMRLPSETRSEGLPALRGAARRSAGSSARP